MTEHIFLFTPGTWLGEGTIKFTESPEWLKYYCRWHVSPEENGEMVSVQEIEVDGVPDKMNNTFTFYEVKPSSFKVRLNNELIGEIEGTGVIDDKLIAWEFRSNQEHGFEGFEVYELQDDGNYTMRGEYASVDQLRTMVDGRIWKAEAKLKS